MKEYDDLVDTLYSSLHSLPLDSDEMKPLFPRHMMMNFFVVPARLVKLKRLVDTLYSKGKNNV
jgi:hypothetical protein